MTGLTRGEYLRASPPLFESALLDRFTRVRPAVVLALYAPVVAGLAAVSLGRQPWPAVLGLALAGYLVWSLAEYWTHRLLLHFTPRGRLTARVHWLVHGIHHEHPQDPLRAVLPPLASLVVTLAGHGVLRLALGPDHALPATAGFVAGYLSYDLLHYHLHHGRPRTRLGRWLRNRHLRHHFEDDTRWYGVSAFWWDRPFGTAGPR
ncbi:sterol desaturase family protein [Bailinhaonella thermotolerans]|uniref:Fatty acid hydroxylase n=1 Tax=Bailinhaonella thermotolerans TaxID=1070861 RepID=A0A3A4B668_9ACTN|nr:sterol desaturase family protein [Bailinhaonella thermotolerans]RJL33531.1 fatty acid hydroxylase [Bailinhaonella thermotolerans]